MFDLPILIEAAGFLIGVVISVMVFINRLNANHKEIMSSLKSIVSDCQKNNKECREDLKQSRKEFTDTLKRLING